LYAELEDIASLEEDKLEELTSMLEDDVTDELKTI
jgi:hypothetical protein